MSFSDLNIDKEYRSFRKDLIKSFFIPVLSETKFYKRAVGYFSSTSLIEVSKGLSGLVRNDGRIQLISSPYIHESDYMAIRTGYELRKEKIVNNLINSLTEPENEFDQARLNLLANLIKNKVLDIKIAFLDNNSTFGLYHEKMGIVEDERGNKIAFSGSLNESQPAYRINYETIDVFCSWKNSEDLSRVISKETAFNSIWNNSEPNMSVIEIPEVKDEIIKKYLKSNPNLDLDELEFEKTNPIESDEYANNSMIKLSIPEDVSLYDYQISAIQKWKSNDYRGIFDMATGTGKTFTALGGIVDLFEFCEGELGIVIVCPFQHLVEQWVEDLLKFGISPIIGYSKSTQKDWKKKLSNSIRDQRLKIKNRSFFCFVTTNASFKTEYVQNQIMKITKNALLVADEAHNFGAEGFRFKLPSIFKYRLALSATLDRHKDKEGTEFLYSYFGNKCIEYSLDQAISEGKLTNYYYYPVLNTLAEEELSDYDFLSSQIAKCIIERNGKKELNERGKYLAIKRSRIIAGAKDKLVKLKTHISPFKDSSHILVYCGAASILEEDNDEIEIDDSEIRQIDAVTLLLGNELNMKVSQFTSKEDIYERTILKREFEKGENLQALIAIKCLDEGVNIPKIKIAFILASTTNPKEYIQRRGRVLRLSEGKDFSIIYDFITLPFELKDTTSLTSDQINRYETLIRNELARGFEFSKISLNHFESEKILLEVQEAFNLNEIYFEL